MLITSIILFTFAAGVGIFIAYQLMSGKKVTLPQTLSHGLFAAVAVIILFITLIQLQPAALLPWIALALFILAALGGTFLLALHLTKGPPSAQLISLHALLAIAALLTLLIYWQSAT